MIVVIRHLGGPQSRHKHNNDSKQFRGNENMEHGSNSKKYPETKTKLKTRFPELSWVRITAKAGYEEMMMAAG